MGNEQVHSTMFDWSALNEVTCVTIGETLLYIAVLRSCFVIITAPRGSLAPSRYLLNKYVEPIKLMGQPLRTSRCEGQACENYTTCFVINTWQRIPTDETTLGEERGS